MNHRQQAHDNREKQASGCIVNVIIPTDLAYVLFGPPIPISSFNFIVFYTCQNYLLPSYPYMSDILHIPLR